MEENGIILDKVRIVDDGDLENDTAIRPKKPIDLEGQHHVDAVFSVRSHVNKAFC